MSVSKALFCLLGIALVPLLNASDSNTALKILPDPDIFDGSLTKSNPQRQAPGLKNKEQEKLEEQKKEEETGSNSSEGNTGQSNQKAEEVQEDGGSASENPLGRLEKPDPVTIGDSSLIVEQISTASVSDIVGTIPPSTPEGETTTDTQEIEDPIGPSNKSQQQERSKGVERGEVIPPGI